MTISGQDVINRIKQNVTCDWNPQTVDTIKAGNATQEITGIATTFMANYAMLETAIDKACNLIITHEPTFYNHLDSKDLLENDSVYQAKQDLIDKHNLIVFRFHDHWHMTDPDGIYVGMIDKLGWGGAILDGRGPVFDLKAETLAQITADLKITFPDAIIRVVGDSDLKVDKTALLVGAPGPARHIKFLQRPDINLIVIGEVPEWETIAYVRDASEAGLQKAMIILGHAVSEEAGMAYCASWLKTFVDEVPIHFIPAGDPFHQ